MSLLDSIKKNLAPIHPEGYPFIGAFALVAIFLFWLARPLGWIGVIATVWCAYFFRDPKRVVPVGEGLVVSPADGRISQVALASPPPELEMGPEQRVRISIFMNVLDVHVNRAPVAGEVRRIVYKAGKFINADLDKASEDNERNSVLLRTSLGPVAVVQIAGLIARRIVCFVREGTSVAAGERIGLIRFGSRVDLYLPGNVRPLVSEGQTALAGETVIADLSAQSRTLTFRND
ncbi:MAG TPA: phosphatidylserine decarboxylase [Xanthobacteraceae bacterium]|nr:phosphatidylserine decarboxylase [Xanthobacteraceae bacterium]